jgi:hypothetical protein
MNIVFEVFAAATMLSEAGSAWAARRPFYADDNEEVGDSCNMACAPAVR